MSARARMAGAVAAMIVLAGCGGHEPPAADPLSGDEPVATLRVGLTEWEVVLPDASLAPGWVRLEVTNVGATTHDLVVTGRRGSWRTPLLSPGERTALAVETVAGELLHLDCRVPGHHSAGMHEQLRVAGEDADVAEGGADATGP